MSRREDREAVNSGCNCLIIIAIALAIVVSGVRSCINGDIKLPRFGSSHVRGGSGGYGTSNGYNVKYNQTTSPNNNSSLRDYTNTNSQPTEYREGKNSEQTSSNSSSTSIGTNNANSVFNSSSPSSAASNTNSSNLRHPKTYYKTCSICNGTGKRKFYDMFNDYGLGAKCLTCGRTDTHRHEEIVTCELCSGRGKILMEIVDGPLGEMEVQHVDR